MPSIELNVEVLPSMFVLVRVPRFLVVLVLYPALFEGTVPEEFLQGVPIPEHGVAALVPPILGVVAVVLEEVMDALIGEPGLKRPVLEPTRLAGFVVTVVTGHYRSVFGC